MRKSFWLTLGPSKYFWCRVLHKKHRVGLPRKRRVSTAYDIHCDKCGLNDTEVILFRHER